jgi:hypothetical protein
LFAPPRPEAALVASAQLVEAAAICVDSEVGSRTVERVADGGAVVAVRPQSADQARVALQLLLLT